MAYFYFDSRNVEKQHFHDLITSLLIQLSARSPLRQYFLSVLYKDHDDGKTQPNDRDLLSCLKQVLSGHPTHEPIYLVMDALDECPNGPEIPSPRERVLDLVKELVELHHPNLRICVTSRLESNIRGALEPLTSFQVLLHNETGQREDIVDYIKSVVNSDSNMKRWKNEVRELVIETLSSRADGMFRLASSQLEVLHHSPLSSVRRMLKELPEPIHKIYEHILREIKEPNRNQALCILQCLAVAVRPLRVEELAEVLAVDFDNPEGIPKLESSHRRDNAEQALLSSCSNLISIVDSYGSRVVQFSHPSVKEFLTSPRLAGSSGDVSRYHIALKTAHTILAQACLASLRSDDSLENGIRKTSPLIGYVAQHWVTHVQFENVLSYLRKPMECLFDSDRLSFAAWVKSRDLYLYSSAGNSLYWYEFNPQDKSHPNDLYSPAFFGTFAEDLIRKYPQQVDAHCRDCVAPLVMALAQEHFNVAELLLRHGATVNIRNNWNRIPLHLAAHCARIDQLQSLLKNNADVNHRDDYGWTALHLSVNNTCQGSEDIARLLLQHRADVNTRNALGNTPLHYAASYGRVTIARVLLEWGAKVDEKNNYDKTPFQYAFESKQNEVMTLLSKYGAKSSR